MRYVVSLAYQPLYLTPDSVLLGDPEATSLMLPIFTRKIAIARKFDDAGEAMQVIARHVGLELVIVAIDPAERD